MHIVEQMLSTTPNRGIAKRSALESCIEACAECELACTACADACLGEREVEPLRLCIRLNQDCADACDMTARILSRQLQVDTVFLRALLEACARICASCGAECQRHAGHHEHCRVCAEACRKCEQECRAMIQALSDRVAAMPE
jgi:hypothetical protein